MGFVERLLTKRQVNALLDFQFLDERNNLVFIGPPGVGKTHLASGSATRQWKPVTECCSAMPWIWWKNWNWPR
mgnify:FL=1